MRNERQIAELIFQLFRNTNCKDNQGFMTNVLNAQVVFHLNPKEKELFNIVYVGLQVLGYISVEEERRFIRLTRKGYDYIYDDDLVSKMQQVPWIIPAYKNTDWDSAYNKLWKIIGPQDSAPYYMSGPKFYSYIVKLCDDLPPSYSDYIDYLNKNHFSNSRVSYYRRLIDHIEPTKRYEFYVHIQDFFESSIFVNDDLNVTDYLLPLLGAEENTNSQTMPINREEKTMINEEEYHPVVFISYSWDNKEHEEWVVKLATKLQTEYGIIVILDKWELKLGKLLPNFMENAISNSQRVICIMTPNYKKKTEKLEGGVGVEYSIISAEIQKNVKTEKFIPLLREGTNKDIPSFLSGRDYIDMHSGVNIDEAIKDLARDIWNVPKYKKPELGPKPEFD